MIFPRHELAFRFISTDECVTLLLNAGVQAVEPLDREGYLAFDERALKQLVFEAHTSHQYLVYRKGFPDCDDFTRAFMGDVIVHAGKVGLTMLPAIAELKLWRKGAEFPHWQAIAITSERRLLLYEPQRRAWSDDFNDIKQLMKARI